MAEISQEPDTPAGTPPGPSGRALALAAGACFFASGATGLIYEVVWVRMMGLVFGHTVYALTTVVAAFMAGLALGSYGFGRVADRSPRPLRLYAFLELGVAGTCAVLPWFFKIAEAIYLALGQRWGLSYASFSALQAVLVFAILVLPTSLMGGTLPAMARVFVRSSHEVRSGVGRLYALNTFGAVAGTALCGFWVLPWLGMRATVWLAVAANLAIGGLAWHLDRRLGAPLAPVSPPGTDPPPVPEPPPALPRPALAALLLTLAVSGGAAMVNQVGWTRALTLMIGSSTYAFTAILLAFLLGIAGGSYLVGRVAPRGRPGFAALALIQIAIGSSGIAMMWAFDWLPEWFLALYRLSSVPGFLVGAQIVLSLAILLAPTLLMGAMFPCALHLAAGGMGRIGRDVGRAYGANTLGAILGTALGGFVLIPSLGIQRSLLTAAVANAASALGLVLVRGSGVGLTGRATVAAGFLAVAAQAWTVPQWDQRVLTSGPAVYARLYAAWAKQGTFLDLARQRGLLFYEDGPGGTVSVHRDGPHLSLRINGKTDANNAGDMRTQLMAGHLPLLLHPAPRRVFILGLGSGVTVGAVLQHPVETVEVVEIEPAVVRASRFFRRENRGALEDHRTRLVIADARHQLAITPERFDVIILEPSNPWIRGLATLFTREFYEIVRGRLKPGGLVVQWVQGYSLAAEDLMMILRTFRQTFPHTTLWNTVAGDYLLLGAPHPQRLDLDAVHRRVAASPGLRGDMEFLGFPSPVAILADFLLGERDIARVAGQGPENTDDLLPLEYSAPFALYQETTTSNLMLLRAARAEGPAALVTDKRRMDDPQTRYEVALALLAKKVPGEALGHLNVSLQRQADFPLARIARARALLMLGKPSEAVADLQAAIRHPQQRQKALYLLGLAYAALGEGAKAEGHLRQALSLGAAPEARSALGRLLASTGRTSEALHEFQAALRAAPADMGALLGMGEALLALGRPAEAIAPLQEASRFPGGNAQVFLALGRAHGAAGQRQQSEDVLKWSLYLDPALAEAYIELSGVYRAEGALDRAIATLERGLSIRPGEPTMTERLNDLRARRPGRS